MVLDALEIGVVVLMAVGVLVWGPEKVPEIAKTISNARKQLEGYTKQLSGISKELQASMDTGNFDNLSNVLTGASAGPISGTPTAAEVAAATQNAGAPAVSPAPAAAQVPFSPLSPPVVKSGDQLLLEMAKQLRVSTQGKTRDEIQAEILERASVAVESRASANGSAVSQSPGSETSTAPTEASADAAAVPQPDAPPAAAA